MRAWRLAMLAASVVSMALAPGHAATEGGGFALLEETADDAFDVTFTLAAPQPWPAGAEAELAFNILDDAHYYSARFAGGQVRLVKVTDGRPAPLCAPAGLPGPRADGTWEVTLQRRQSRMAVICNGMRVAATGDAEYRRGRVGSRSTRDDVRLSDIAYQVVAPPHMEDDFMREGEQAGSWEPIAGTWENAGPTGPKPTPQQSANPFSYRCSAPGQYGLAVAGDWFWDSYEAKVAVRPMDDGAVGLCVYYQDPENYFLFRWAGLADGQGRKQVLRVRDGQGVPLAQAEGGYQMGQWYVLAVRVFDGHLQALIDGEVVLEAYDESFGEGAVGLYVAECQNAYFDDVQVRSYEGLADGFAPPEMGRWQPVAGQWNVEQEHLYGQPGRGSAGAGRLAAAIAAYGEWEGFDFSALVKPKTAGAVGLRFYVRDDANYHLFRWTGGKAGQQQLLRVRDGKPTLLASRPRSYEADRMYRMGISADGGHIVALVDGEPALEVADGAEGGRRVGLQAEGAGAACFDNIVVLPRLQDEHSEKIQRQFVREDTMTMWTMKASEWRRESDAYWYVTPLFADHAMALELPPLRARDGSLDVFLCADGQRTDSGFLLTLQKRSTDPNIEVRLQQAGQVLQTATAPAGDGEQRVELRRSGSWVIATLDGRLLVSYQSASPPAGYFCGFKSVGLGVEVGAVRVTSPSLYDYAFSSAPVDWRPQQGVWEVADRWACSPGWAWFRGSGHQSPVIWSKAAFRGNLDLRFWCAFQHPYREPSPGDLNATICGDGANLCSGYNFIFAGDNNAGSKILRGNTPVVSNSGIRCGTKDFYHRHWFELCIRKIGRKLTYHVDGKLVGEYEDPTPLDGGRIALWSYNGNGILIARARVSFEQRVP